MKETINALTPVLRGWISYFRLTEVRGVQEELDGWIKRKLRCLLWRQWKRSGTRTKNLRRTGLSKDRAMIAAYNNHGLWWKSGASHMNQAIKNTWFSWQRLISLLEQQRQFQC
ncbi:group II intron maturase-specific domain-containing protein [Escherichia coli]|uniref:group II intron maturase-specific domain-containing protein n=1 Tax=Escherichia coli TaxID=562 RepID=UPI00384D373E